jgi:GFO/IDH/MocA oxidoreductase family protein/uncharacterized protein DUF5916
MPDQERPTLGVGMVGYAFMGAAHSQAWRNAARFFELPMAPAMVAVAGRDGDAVAAAADRLGWSSWETDWKQLLTRDDVQLVDICTPGDTHAEIAIAALDADKHVLCEKPLANTVEEAVAMTEAAERAQRRGHPDFNYMSLRGNAVLRWEYRPGSTLYLVWTQTRDDLQEHEGNFEFGPSMQHLSNTDANNIFLAKVTYYFNL